MSDSVLPASPDEQQFSIDDMRDAFEQGWAIGCQYNKFVAQGWHEYKARKLAASVVLDKPQKENP